MPKYYPYKIAGYYLYYTSHCTLECMHVHASDDKLTEKGSAKFYESCINLNRIEYNRNR